MKVLASEEVEFISWHELPESEQKDNAEDYDQESQWFKFDESYYPLHLVMRTEDKACEYHGTMHLTNASGLGLVLSPCGEGARVDLLM